MSKKGLLIGTVLVFLLIASAMALENRSAGENFTSQDYLYSKSIESDAPASSGLGDSGAGYEENIQKNLRNGPKLLSTPRLFLGY